jgi:uncharacterized protein (TIGR02453 family)
MPFSTAAFRFFRGLAKNNNKGWFEAHREDYEQEVREPMRQLIADVNGRLARVAPEIGGDPKKTMFRINRDIRFSKDKSPYKTNAACWFHHRGADSRVGSAASDGSAGFYFHLEPGKSVVGAGLWMPSRPQLDKLRNEIAEDPQGFERVAKGLVKRYGGLDSEAVLKRMPRGYAETQPGATWLRYQSFTAGRRLTDADVTSSRLAAILEKDFVALLPLVRWLNSALGFPSQRIGVSAAQSSSSQSLSAGAYR